MTRLLPLRFPLPPFLLPLLVLPFVLSAPVPATAQTAEEWLTDYELSGHMASPTWTRTMQYLRRLEAASPWIRVTSFGTTPQGRALPLVILSRDGAFTPEAAKATGKPIVLIQAGIHSGEIDGKDAGMMLLRDIAVTKTHERLADKVIVLFMPIFNLDGHERRGPNNRINQRGPVETGWRVTSRNLNLNRDYLKADAPEMRAWLGTFNAWLPDLLIDCHVTDGIDFQYRLTYSMEMFANAAPAIVKWQKRLQEQMVRGMAALEDPIFPYVFPREDKDLSKGLRTYAAPPRFSTGYAAVRNRPSLLVETHSLKPYQERVTATWRLLVEVLTFVNTRPKLLRDAVTGAERETIELFAARKKAAAFPLRFEASEKSRPVPFKAWRTEIRRSDISGGEYQVYDHDAPETVTVPFFDDVQPSLTVEIPRAYLVPAEYADLIEILRLHGVRVERLTEDQEIISERMTLTEPKWRAQSYEGRQTLTAFESSVRIDTAMWPAGTFLVRVSQLAGRAAMHLLEPRAPDSFLAWGFLNAIFEQKEYFESFVLEEMAPKLLRSTPGLRDAFEARLQSDSAFAANPRARLSFIYERSPWADSRLGVYPFTRIMTEQRLKAVAEEGWKRPGEE